MAKSFLGAKSADLVHLTCPACGSKLRAPARSSGQTFPCPRCRRPLAVPTDKLPEALPIAEPIEDKTETNDPAARSSREDSAQDYDFAARLRATPRANAPPTGAIGGIASELADVVRVRYQRWGKAQRRSATEALIRAKLVAMGTAVLEREIADADLARDLAGERKELADVLEAIQDRVDGLTVVGASGGWSVRQALRNEIAELSARRDDLLARVGEAALARGLADPSAVKAVCQLRARLKGLDLELAAGETAGRLLLADLLIPGLRSITMAAALVLVLAGVGWLGVAAVRSALPADAAMIRSVRGPEVAEAVGFVVAGARVVDAEGRRFEQPVSSGTAFAVTPEGHMLTNRHVVEEVWNLSNAPHVLAAKREREQVDYVPVLWVYLHGRKHEAKILHVSEKYDLAILKVEQVSGPFYALSTRENPGRGTASYSLGFPGVSGLETSSDDKAKLDLMKGQVHADVSRYFPERDFTYVEKTGTISRAFQAEDGVRWIEHNSDINHGNSGGPLVDDSGCVVAINTRTATPIGGHGTFFSFPLGQCRDEIEARVPGIVWE